MILIPLVREFGKYPKQKEVMIMTI